MFNNWTIFETVFLFTGIAISYFSTNKAKDLLILIGIYALLMASLA